MKRSYEEKISIQPMDSYSGSVDIVRPGIMNRMSHYVHNPSNTLHQWTRKPIAACGNVQIETSLLRCSQRRQLNAAPGEQRVAP